MFIGLVHTLRDINRNTLTAEHSAHFVPAHPIQTDRCALGEDAGSQAGRHGPVWRHSVRGNWRTRYRLKQSMTYQTLISRLQRSPLSSRPYVQSSVTVQSRTITYDQIINSAISAHPLGQVHNITNITLNFMLDNKTFNFTPGPLLKTTVLLRIRFNKKKKRS